MLYDTPSPERVDAPSGSTIMLIEDDPAIELTLRRALTERGYRIISAATGAEARAWLLEVQPDLIILDLVLPDADGLVLSTTLQTSTRAPILICSARNTQVDRVLGLKLGAADFVAKPFDLDELEARIYAILRRAARSAQATAAAPSEIRIRDLVIAPSRGTVTMTNHPLHLTPTEYRLLSALATEPEAVFDRRSLTKQVWGIHDSSCDHMVDVHVGRLRAKLRSVQTDVPYVVTVRGRGFRLLGTED
jgi:two-component system OmpR family response regulator